MSSRARKASVVAAIAAVVTIVLIAIRALQPPIPLAELVTLRAGMSTTEVAQILGQPSRIYPGGESYTVKGTNYTMTEQWTYQRFLTFGFVNIHFDTNGTFAYHNYEEF